MKNHCLKCLKQISAGLQSLVEINSAGLPRLPLLIVFAALTAAAQIPVEPGEVKADENYRVGIGDVLRVTVVKQTLLSVDAARVGNDGTIRLPMIEEAIPAACQTESELAETIGKRYKKYLLEPQIYVAVREFNANPVTLVGAVVTPARVQLQRPVRLLELLAVGNGPAPNAGKNIQIIRTLNSRRCGSSQSQAVQTTADAAEARTQEMISLPLAEVLKGDDKFNPYVESGDIVRLTEAKIEQAFIVGNVKSAVIINLKEPTTLTKAIAMAGGTASGANLEKVKILRQLPDSLSKTETIVNLKEINSRRREDMWLEPNDIVEVPGPSGTRKLLREIFRSTIPIATGITGVPIIIP